MKSTQRQFCANILHFLKSGFPKLHISPTPDSGGHPRAWLPHAPKSSNGAGRGGDHDPTSRVWCTTSSSKHSAYWCERCACKAKRGGEKQHFAKFPPLQLGCRLSGRPHGLASTHYLFARRDDTQIIYRFLSFDSELPVPGQRPVPGRQWAAVTPAGPRAARVEGGGQPARRFPPGPPPIAPSGPRPVTCSATARNKHDPSLATSFRYKPRVRR